MIKVCDFDSITGSASGSGLAGRTVIARDSGWVPFALWNADDLASEFSLEGVLQNLLGQAQVRHQPTQLAVSSSSCLSRRTSASPIPAYCFFHRKDVYSETPIFRRT